MPERLQTGIQGLDRLLGGGIPRGHSIIIAGEPGTGKSSACAQIAFSHAQRGNRSVLVTVTSEPHHKYVESIRGFTFFDEPRVGEEVFLVSALPWLEGGPKETREGIFRTLRERHADLLLIDGFRNVRDL